MTRVMQRRNSGRRRGGGVLGRGGGGGVGHDSASVSFSWSVDLLVGALYRQGCESGEKKWVRWGVFMLGDSRNVVE